MAHVDEEYGARWLEMQLASNEFSDLLIKIEEYISVEAGREFLLNDRSILRLKITEILMLHSGMQLTNKMASRSTLHEINEPLAKVIEILRNPANSDHVLVSLGAPFMLALSPNQTDVETAIARFDDLLDSLNAIAENLPPQPQKRGKGRPPNDELQVLVEMLATYWVRATGKPFKQDWLNGDPLTNATKFVHEVIKFLDKKSLSALPKKTANIVKYYRRPDSVVSINERVASILRKRFPF